MQSLKAFLLGAVALGVVGYALVGALAVTAQATGRTLELGLGPLALVTVVREGDSTVTTFGPALLAVALVGGFANLGAERLLRRRSHARADRVD